MAKGNGAISNGATSPVEDKLQQSPHPQVSASEQADAKSIFAHALESVLPEPALRRHVSLDQATNTLTVAGRTYNLDRYERIIVVGGGKAARRTGAELVSILGDRITAGVLNVYREQAREPLSDRIK